uniref:Sentrin-specific protease 1 n=1 Tax=Cacopsylla melanoneura TaxID=428564 RepID=A0A8D8WVL1_9HEMI
MGKKECHHILAAKMSIGVEKQVQSQLQLTKLIKSKRGYRSGRKTEPKSLQIVEAAADSTAIKSGEHGTTVLLPTIEKNIVKRRFIDPVPETHLTVNNNHNTTDMYNSRDDDTDVSFKEVKTTTPRRQMTSENEPEKRMKKIKIENITDDEVTVNNNKSRDEYTEMSFKDVKTSTPRRQMTSENITKKKRLILVEGNVSDVSLEDEILIATNSDSFDLKFNNNRCFVTFGLHIYPQILKPLSYKKLPKPSETLSRFLFEAVMEFYIRCLIYERFEKKLRKDVFCTDTNILTLQNFRTRFDPKECPGIVRYAVRQRLLSKKIIFIPIIEHSHCTLLIAHMQTKSIFYLNSFRGPEIAMTHAKRLLSLLSVLSEQYYMQEFRTNEWKLYVPTEVCVQRNGYDCGTYVCTFADFILSKTTTELDPIKMSDLDLLQYRTKIYNKLRYYMKHRVPEESYHVKERLILTIDYDPVENANSISVEPEDFPQALSYLKSKVAEIQ